eukprot:CAMPEP_0116012772 /NCGR_PEP_ID=MMETSP0321-20121206/5321_1 /TAXON_ID=163516 /ORGANISM="Leptocylindrus danicus var. danicus, Strain B650" /LENGTH=872 /DNA_ID=CAMNT_0003482177 /DNA_START=760 /DNA_END=3375 /DNA_ORIENTATION=-
MRGCFLSLRKLCQKANARVKPEKNGASASYNRETCKRAHDDVATADAADSHRHAKNGSTIDLAFSQNIVVDKKYAEDDFGSPTKSVEVQINNGEHESSSSSISRKDNIDGATKVRRNLVDDNEQLSNTTPCCSDGALKAGEECSASEIRMDSSGRLVQLDEEQLLSMKNGGADPKHYVGISIKAEGEVVCSENLEVCFPPIVESERFETCDQNQRLCNIETSPEMLPRCADSVLASTPLCANEKSISFLETKGNVEERKIGYDDGDSSTEGCVNNSHELSPEVSVSEITSTHVRNEKSVSFLMPNDYDERNTTGDQCQESLTHDSSSSALESSLGISDCNEFVGSEKSVSFLEPFQSPNSDVAAPIDHNSQKNCTNMSRPLKSFRQMQSIADLARNHYQQIAKSYTNMKYIADLDKANIRRNSKSMPTLLSKRKARLSVLVEGDEKRSSSIRELRFADSALRSFQDCSVRSVKEVNQVRHGSLSTENGDDNVINDSAITCHVSATTESSFFDRNKMRCLDITNDEDWISVSDDENDDSLAFSSSLRIKPPKIHLPCHHHFGRKGSYTFTNSGTLWVDGFGKAITNRGIKLGQSPLGSIAMRDRLVFLCKLGEGASGTVFKALDLCSLKLVAVKIISIADKRKRRQIVSELANLHELLRDSRVATSGDFELNGEDCIVELIDAFSDANDKSVGICFEYMDGGSLQDIVDKGECANESILSGIAYQCLLGIGLLHRNNQVHRDIKPANILISTRGQVKIGDLGISRHLKVDELELSKTQNSSKSSIGTADDSLSGTVNSKNSAASSFVGTLTYMSPERINGQTYTYSADIWSLGLSLLATALGRLPIENHGFWSVMNCVNGANPPSLPVEDDSW